MTTKHMILKNQTEPVSGALIEFPRHKKWTFSHYNCFYLPFDKCWKTAHKSLQPLTFQNKTPFPNEYKRLSMTITPGRDHACRNYTCGSDLSRDWTNEWMEELNEYWGMYPHCVIESRFYDIIEDICWLDDVHNFLNISK